MPLSAELTTAQDLLITFTPTDEAGAPSAIQLGSLVGTSVTPDVIGDGAIVNPADYGLVDVWPEALLCVTTGALGAYGVDLAGDSDTGEGVETISDTVTGTVSHARAKQLGAGAVGVPKKRVA